MNLEERVACFRGTDSRIVGQAKWIGSRLAKRIVPSRGTRRRWYWKVANIARPRDRIRNLISVLFIGRFDRHDKAAFTCALAFDRTLGKNRRIIAPLSSLCAFAFARQRRLLAGQSTISRDESTILGSYGIIEQTNLETRCLTNVRGWVKMGLFLSPTFCLM